jgi:DNA-binding response OmpR family regulator
MKILIIEDERELLNSIEVFLAGQGFICEKAGSFDIAFEKLSIYEYDIILLDITLPDGNGLDLIKTIKKFNPNAGVIIISARNSLDDKINGLDLGADDYMTKPFELAELNSRVKALIRRRQFNGKSIVKFNEIEINTESKEVRVNDKTIILTKKEYDLLLFLVVNKNRVLTKEAIAEHLWQDNIDLADNFDFVYTHINAIRRKIKQAGCNDYIQTQYAMGYKFTDI